MNRYFFKSIFATLCVTCLFVSTIRAQDAAKAADVLANARTLYAQEGPTKSLPEFEKALVLFQKEGDRKGEAITIGLIGNCYKKLGQHAKALEYLQRALAMKRELGDRREEGRTLSHLGLFYWDTGDYPKAIDHLNQASAVAKELGDRTLEGSIHNNIGLVYDEIGDARSIDEYKRAIELYGSEPTRPLSDAIGNTGGWHLLHGNYAEALRYYQQALDIDETLKLKPSIAIDLENIGLALTGLGRSREALETLDRAITLAHDAGLVKEEADSRKAKASALLQLSRHTEALEQYKQSIQVYRQAGLNGDPQFKQNLVEGLGDLGNLEIRLGDVTSAERDFRQAIDLSEQIKHPRGVTINLISLGDVQLRQKRYREAAVLYNQALSRANAAGDSANAALARIQLAHTHRSLKEFEEAEKQARLAQASANETHAKPLEAEALYALAETLRTQGRPEDALNTFSEGLAIVRDTVSPELSWRFNFGRGQLLESVNRNEEALVELLLKLGREDEAFVAAEKLRARSYLDLIDRGQPPIRNQTQREKESALRSRIRELQKNLEEETSKANPEQKRQKVDLYSKELAGAETEYETFLDDLASSEPTYRAVRGLKVPTRDEVSKKLLPDTTLIEYILGEDAVYIFVVNSDRLSAKKIPVRSEDLSSRVETLRDLMLRKQTSEWKLPAAALYQTLIAPIESAGWLKNTKQLYIIPHAILHYLPFAVLESQNSLLIDKYIIAYLPSAAALVLGPQASPPANSTSILAMAPSNTRLQFTRMESESVSSFYPKQHTLLVGPRATESAFKKLAADYDVIHLATHGYFNKQNPLLSGLQLESDAMDDGRLEVHEIMNLNLKSKLVTLSACDTAVGSGYFSDIPPGDDLVGLTRAFLSTGAPSVLASLWEINDRSAVTFMDSFYRQLRQTDKATALAVVQRQMRQRGMYRHPYYWAAFVMVGEMK
jgi:CHAT domain-containing protein/Tfp pilus assembly protein PilF